MVERRIEEQEIQPHLRNGHGAAIDQQLNLYLGGTSAVT